MKNKSLKAISLLNQFRMVTLVVNGEYKRNILAQVIGETYRTAYGDFRWGDEDLISVHTYRKSENDQTIYSVSTQTIR